MRRSPYLYCWIHDEDRLCFMCPIGDRNVCYELTELCIEHLDEEYESRGKKPKDGTLPCVVIGCEKKIMSNGLYCIDHCAGICQEYEDDTTRCENHVLLGATDSKCHLHNTAKFDYTLELKRTASESKEEDDGADAGGLDDEPEEESKTVKLLDTDDENIEELYQSSNETKAESETKIEVKSLDDCDSDGCKCFTVNHIKVTEDHDFGIIYDGAKYLINRGVFFHHCKYLEKGVTLRDDDTECKLDVKLGSNEDFHYFLKHIHDPHQHLVDNMKCAVSLWRFADYCNYQSLKMTCQKVIQGSIFRSDCVSDLSHIIKNQPSPVIAQMIRPLIKNMNHDHIDTYKFMCRMVDELKAEEVPQFYNDSIIWIANAIINEKQSIDKITQIKTLQGVMKVLQEGIKIKITLNVRPTSPARGPRGSLGGKGFIGPPKIRSLA